MVCPKWVGYKPSLLANSPCLDRLLAGSTAMQHYLAVGFRNSHITPFQSSRKKKMSLGVQKIEVGERKVGRWTYLVAAGTQELGKLGMGVLS